MGDASREGEGERCTRGFILPASSDAATLPRTATRAIVRPGAGGWWGRGWWGAAGSVGGRGGGRGAGSAELVVWQGGEELVVWHRPRDTVGGRRERAVDSWTRTGARSAGQDSKIYAAPVGPSIFTQLVPERAYARRYAATADRQIRFCVVDVL